MKLARRLLIIFATFFAASSVHALQLKAVPGEGTLADRISAVADNYTDAPAVMEIIDFIRADSSRRLVQPDTDNGA